MLKIKSSPDRKQREDVLHSALVALTSNPNAEELDNSKVMTIAQAIKGEKSLMQNALRFLKVRIKDPSTNNISYVVKAMKVLDVCMPPLGLTFQFMVKDKVLPRIIIMADPLEEYHVAIRDQAKRLIWHWAQQYGHDVKMFATVYDKLRDVGAFVGCSYVQGESTAESAFLDAFTRTGGSAQTSIFPQSTSTQQHTWSHGRREEDVQHTTPGMAAPGPSAPLAMPSSPPAAGPDEVPLSPSSLPASARTALSVTASKSDNSTSETHSAAPLSPPSTARSFPSSFAFGPFSQSDIEGLLPSSRLLVCSEPSTPKQRPEADKGAAQPPESPHKVSDPSEDWLQRVLSLDIGARTRAAKRCDRGKGDTAPKPEQAALQGALRAKDAGSHRQQDWEADAGRSAKPRGGSSWASWHGHPGQQVSSPAVSGTFRIENVVIKARGAGLLVPQRTVASMALRMGAAARDYEDRLVLRKDEDNGERERDRQLEAKFGLCEAIPPPRPAPVSTKQLIVPKTVRSDPVWYSSLCGLQFVGGEEEEEEDGEEGCLTPRLNPYPLAPILPPL